MYSAGFASIFSVKTTKSIKGDTRLPDVHSMGAIEHAHSRKPRAALAKPHCTGHVLTWHRVKHLYLYVQDDLRHPHHPMRASRRAPSRAPSGFTQKARSCLSMVQRCVLLCFLILSTWKNPWTPFASSSVYPNSLCTLAYARMYVRGFRANLNTRAKGRYLNAFKTLSRGCLGLRSFN